MRPDGEWEAKAVGCVALVVMALVLAPLLIGLWRWALGL